MAKNKLPKELTTVTPLSKLVTGALFVFLPIISFLMGMNYQRQINAEITYKMRNANNSFSLLVPTKVPKKIEIPSDWKTYTNKNYSFQFKHPINLTPREVATTKTSTITIQPKVMTLDIETSADTKNATNSATQQETIMKIGMTDWKIEETDTGTTYTMKKEGNTYTFMLMNKEEEYKKIAEMILTSLSFESK